MWGIIGGSGFEKFDAFETVEEISRETPFGLASSGIKKIKLGSQEALFVSRHGSHHELLPTEVNYRANIFALKSAGATALLSFSAVGSLRENLEPGDLVIPSQYIDRTKGVRAHTYCGDGVVGHVSLANPVCRQVSEKVIGLLKGMEYELHWDKTYVCIEGPYFSTKAESHMYRQLGADIIGMTNFPEFALAREAGLNYLPCCFVTDFDCWNEERPHVTLEEVIDVMRKNNSKAFSLAETVLNLPGQPKQLWEGGDDATDQGLRMGLMTPKENLPKEKQQWLETLMR